MKKLLSSPGRNHERSTSPRVQPHQRRHKVHSKSHMPRVCSWECKQLIKRKETQESYERREKRRKKVLLEAKSLVQRILDYWTSDGCNLLNFCLLVWWIVFNCIFVAWFVLIYCIFVVCSHIFWKVQGNGMVIRFLQVIQWATNTSLDSIVEALCHRHQNDIVL